jgi:hypothetical protein
LTIFDCVEKVIAILCEFRGCRKKLKTIYFAIIDNSCDACINDLHQLLGIQQAELKRPARSANAKVSKWQKMNL